MRTLALRHSAPGRRPDLRLFRRIVRHLLQRELKLPAWDLGICLVGDAEIQRLNERYLQHAGPTDVLAFDYGAPPPGPLRQPAREFGSESRPAIHQVPPSDAPSALAERRQPLHGEIFIGLDVALRQSRRFRTTPAQEVVRYAVHGILHLLGHDDHHAAARRRMKSEENRLVRRLCRQFAVDCVFRRPRRGRPT